MLVADLRHFLGLSDSAPGPARRLGEQLSLIVQAATAGPAGSPWASAVRCQRRPGRRPCPGRIVVFRASQPAPIRWECCSCADAGTISEWEHTAFDLRAPHPTSPNGPTLEVRVDDEVMDALRGIPVLDPDSERIVFAARALHGGGALLAANAVALDELAGFVAAAANHEPNRRRQRRLDAAFEALTETFSPT